MNGTYPRQEFCYSLHLDGSTISKVTLGDVRQFVATVNALSLPDEIEIDDCLLSLYIRYDQYPQVSKSGHLILPEGPPVQ